MRPTSTQGFDLAGLKERLASAPEADQLHEIGLREIVVSSDAIAELPRIVDRLEAIAPTCPLVVLQDATSMRRNGADLKEAVLELLSESGPTRPVTIGPSDGDVHADETTVAEATAACADASCLVTVGSGTLVDIGKLVASERGNLPHVVVQTAASVNGFADDLSVLLRHGVKRTVPTGWPDVLVVDLATLAEAPAEMNLAGFGDLAAMFTALADWYIASEVGMDDAWLPTVAALTRERGDVVLGLASGLARRDDDALWELSANLTLSGISMGIAGRTTPSSGMEHTVSHLLEMAAGRHGDRSPFHGAKVGVATVIAAVTWRRVRERLGAGALGNGWAPTDAEMRERISGAFDGIDPTGAIANECWSDYSKKLERWRGSEDRLVQLQADWHRHEAVIDEILVEPQRLVEAFTAAGAPVRFSDLDPPVDAETARWAVANCHLVRERFTVADLATFLGGWTPDDVDAVLEDAAVLGAGL